MTRLSQMFRPVLIGAASLLLGVPAQAQLVETVKDYVITIEENSNDCESARNVGDLCGPELNVVYIGEGVSGRKLFTTVLPLASAAWNNGQTNSSWTTLTNIQGNINGVSNTSTLITRDADSGLSGTQLHAAAAACANLVHGGYDDWHLPALGEAHRLFLARAHISGSSNVIWTSTEDNSTNALTLNLATGASGTSTKSTLRPVQCVRLGETQLAAAKNCSTVQEIGETCGNGNVVYLGPSVSGGGLFAASFYYLPTVTWNNGQTNSSWVTQTNVQSGVNGAANTATLATLDPDSGWSGIQTHAAAEACENMSYGGYSDWYLPAAAEIHPIFLNRSSLPAWVQGATVWTSTEVSSTTATAYEVGTGVLTPTAKSAGRSLLCVRKQAVDALTPTPCETASGVGASCGDGNVVLVGESIDGGRLFASGFQLPAVSWNNGQTNSSWTALTGLTSGTTGRANTGSLATLDADSGWSGTQRHAAAETCNSMVLGGYDDWYLPASFEAAELTRNLAHVPVKTGVLWTSTEDTSTNAVTINVATGATASAAKATRNLVQCVRRETAPVVSDVDCDTVTEVGGVCGNGRVVRIGDSLSGYPLYATSALLPATTWNNGQTNSSYTTLTNVQSGISGVSNTVSLAARDADSGWSGTQFHLAAKTCSDMVYGGYDDWYLPASHEALELFRNAAQVPAALRSGTVWTSTEVNATNASAFNLGTGAAPSVAKSTSYPTLCVRNGSAPTEAEKPCDTVTGVGETCGTGQVVYAGKSPSGGDLFTTSFLLPSTSWNNGQTNGSWVTQTNVQSGINGAANTATLATLDADSGWSLTQTHSAAEICRNMTYGGYDDWYLPGVSEARALFLNRASLPVQSGTVWTSSEVVSSTARDFNVGTGAVSSQAKSASRSLLCVRKEEVPGLVPPSDCGQASSNGEACAGGSVLYVGDNVLGERIFTTALQFPSVFWNNGNTTTSSMITTNRSSTNDGAANTAALAVADADTLSGLQLHKAAATCHQLVMGGFDDWYLPAIEEAEFLYANRAGLPTLGQIWSSTEAAQTTAIALTSTGTRTTISKASEVAVQCVRKDPPPSVVASFAYTGAVQTWTVPETGIYRLNAFGAQGAPGTGTDSSARNGTGGPGGYARGDVLLTAGTVVRVYVGGAGAGVSGGWNGGGAGFSQSSNRISGGGGGATDFRIGGTSLYDRVLVAGGGGGGAGAATSGGGSPGGGGGGGYFGGGGGGGSTGSVSSTCQAPTKEGAFGRFGAGGAGGGSGCTSGTYYAPGNGGPGGALAAASGSTNTTRGFGGGQDLGGTGGVRVIAGTSAGGGGGGGSSYIGRVQNGAVSEGVKTGHGAATIQFVRSSQAGDVELASAERRWFFDYTGTAQLWFAPVSGRYRIIAHGARGSDGAAAHTDARNGAGGLGALATGEITLSAGTTASVYVGERPMAGDGSAEVTGGWNGGGNGATQSTSRASGGGGGATDIRIGGTALGHRVLVAGGGGGGAGASQTGGGSPGGGGGGGYYGGGGGGGYTGSTTSSCQTSTYSGTAGVFGVGGSGGNANCTSGTYRAPNAGGNAGLVGADGGAATTRGGGATQSAGGAGGVRSLAGTASGGGGGGGSSWVTGTASFPVINGSVTTSTRRWHGFVTIEYLGP